MFERSGNSGELLDIACGVAAFSSDLQERGWKVTGVEMVEALAEGAHERVPVVRADVGSQSLPFRSASFDGVLAGEIIEHLVDTTGFLEEIRRVLRPGGVAVVTTPNLASFENRVRLLFGRYPIWVDYRPEIGEGHVRAYTARTLRAHAEDIGFIHEATVGNWVPFVPQRFLKDTDTKLIWWTGRAMASLSMGLITLLRRPT